jgi:hypothetical protein
MVRRERVYLEFHAAHDPGLAGSEIARVDDDLRAAADRGSPRTIQTHLALHTKDYRGTSGSRGVYDLPLLVLPAVALI